MLTLKDMNSMSAVHVHNEKDLPICRGCFGDRHLKPMDRIMLRTFCELTGTLISNDDIYPKYICLSCFSMMKKLFAFRQQAQTVYHKLSTMALWNNMNLANIRKLSNLPKAVHDLDTSPMEHTEFKPTTKLNYTEILMFDVTKGHMASCKVKLSNDANYPEVPVIANAPPTLPPLQTRYVKPTRSTKKPATELKNLPLGAVSQQYQETNPVIPTATPILPKGSKVYPGPKRGASKNVKMNPIQETDTVTQQIPANMPILISPLLNPEPVIIYPGTSIVNLPVQSWIPGRSGTENLNLKTDLQYPINSLPAPTKDIQTQTIPISKAKSKNPLVPLATIEDIRSLAVPHPVQCIRTPIVPTPMAPDNATITNDPKTDARNDVLEVKVESKVPDNDPLGNINEMDYGINETTEEVITEHIDIKDEIIKEENLIHPVDDYDDNAALDLNADIDLNAQINQDQNVDNNTVHDAVETQTKNQETNNGVVELESSSSTVSISSPSSSSSDNSNDGSKVEEVDLTVDDNDDLEQVLISESILQRALTRKQEQKKTDSISKVSNNQTKEIRKPYILNLTIDPLSQSNKRLHDYSTISAENAGCSNAKVTKTNSVSTNQTTRTIESAKEQEHLNVNKRPPDLGDHSDYIIDSTITIEIEPEPLQTADNGVKEIASTSSVKPIAQAKPNDNKVSDDESSDDDLPDCLIGLDSDIYKKDDRSSFKGPKKPTPLKFVEAPSPVKYNPQVKYRPTNESTANKNVLRTKNRNPTVKELAEQFDINSIVQEMIAGNSKRREKRINKNSKVSAEENLMKRKSILDRRKQAIAQMRQNIQTRRKEEMAKKIQAMRNKR